MSTNESESVYILTREEYERYKENYYNQDILQSVVNGIPIWVTIALLLLGVVTNCLNVIVFTRRLMKSVFNFLLAILEGVNIVLYLTMIPRITAHFLQIPWNNYYFLMFFRVSYYLLIFSVCVSNWLTVTVSVFRFVAVTWPLESVSLLSKTLALNTVKGLIFLSSVILVTYASLFQFHEIKIKVVANSTLIEEVQLYSSGLNLNSIANSTMQKLFPSMNILVYTVPCCLTIVATILLVFNLWRARKIRSTLVLETGQSATSESGASVLSRIRNSEERITLILLMVVLLQLMAHVPPSIVYTCALVCSNTETLPKFISALSVSKFLLIVSNCATFLVYFAMSKRFRVTLLRLLRCEVKFGRKPKITASGSIASNTTLTSRV